MTETTKINLVMEVEFHEVRGEAEENEIKKIWIKSKSKKVKEKVADSIFYTYREQDATHMGNMERSTNMRSYRVRFYDKKGFPVINNPRYKKRSFSSRKAAIGHLLTTIIDSLNN